MKKVFRIFLTCVFLLLFCLMLSHPMESLYYSFTGLTLWFEKMIPTLFPFMILSGIMVRMNLTEYFSALLTPLLKPVFQVSGHGVYCMLMGFFCGFPMGAKVIDDLYERGKLSRKEASYLLAFCNNIGPIYFISFVLPLLGLKGKLPYLFGMYGIPLCYGMILSRLQARSVLKSNSAKELSLSACSTSLPKKDSLLAQIDDSILSAIENITKLGGYMILFNLLNLFPAMCLPEKMLPVINALLEITSGISRIGKRQPLTVLLLLPFGGFSCIAQTYSILKNTDLSISHYCIHKCILTLLTALYYGSWFGIHRLFPASVPFLF